MPEAQRAVRVRPAVEADADLLSRWVLAVAWESEGTRLDRTVVAAGVKEALVDPPHRWYFVAERDGDPVGCTMVTTEWSDWSASWYWWLQSVYVEPEHRGGDPSVLDALFDHVHESARGAGVRKVLLYVDRDNRRAVRAYEKRGYQPSRSLIYERALHGRKGTP